MSDVLVQCYLAALAAMAYNGPRNLEKKAQSELEDVGVAGDVGLTALAGYLNTTSLNDTLRKQLHLMVAKWDMEETAAAWAKGTKHRTPERREAIYAALGLNEPAMKFFGDAFPQTNDGAIVISDKFEPWYTPERRQAGAFYWPAYSKYLMETRGWESDSIAELDDATSRVVERLSDPQRSEAYQSKGLVVGYVQSGKTANFTGVLAKAIDAGYRLIIILTGTVEILREQTQRRIDMELIGRENILREIDESDDEAMVGFEYQDDPDWPAKFISHGGRPSTRNYPDIIRLTTRKFDYKSLKAGIVALEIEKANKALPLYNPANLPNSSARVVVVKKNKAVLEKLVKDLKRIRSRLGEIPALIIDDESDQASVNTSDPKKWSEGRTERTAINGLIAQLLKQLPRSQYIGYTATPFANVFIDPNDTEDIFPKDFLISLDRAPGYMGVSEFHDLDSVLSPSERTVENSREKAHVRDIRQNTGRTEKLLEAIDAYILSGAVKLYRETQSGKIGHFRHHTMLVHESVKTSDHGVVANDIRSVWKSAGYSSPAGQARLKKLFDDDFLPVAKAHADGPFPKTFEELKVYIPQVVTNVTKDGGDPVIVVNGDKDLANEAIEFDKRPVWRILVGGTKLSRGFTVEGLTVSWYRRKTKQADTLMQMGRWFGYRRGYKDLVRLYIGREEPDGAKKIDLYEAFEAVVQDEEAFRSQLRQYSKLKDGQPIITPARIPPLVSQHLWWLKPAAKNKMFNATLVVRGTPGELATPTLYPEIRSPECSANYDAMIPLMTAADTLTDLPFESGTSFPAFVGKVPHSVFKNAVSSLKWGKDGYFAPDIAYLDEIDNEIDEWVIIMPQHVDSSTVKSELPSVGNRTVFKRKIRDTVTGRWGEFTDRKHRPAAEMIVGDRPRAGDNIADYVSTRRGAVLVYPMSQDLKELNGNLEKGDIVIGLAWIVCKKLNNNPSQVLRFSVRNKEKANSPIVDISN